MKFKLYKENKLYENFYYEADLSEFFDFIKAPLRMNK